VTFRQMPREEQARHEAASGTILGTVQQLRFIQRHENYREQAACLFHLLALLAEEEAKALDDGLE
jgi:hypothetical protein